MQYMYKQTQQIANLVKMLGRDKFFNNVYLD